jgi:uroporphyrin-III C-methyltransferase
MSGHLYLIGAGLKYEHISIRGYTVLKKADIILYDRLVDKNLLNLSNAEKIDVGKLPCEHGKQQNCINELLIKYLLEDKVVVRLKGGDTSIFARTLEEVEIAKSVRAKIEIVPGITAASVAVSKLMCSLTDRQTSSGVIFITGHKCQGDLEKLYDWDALVKLNMTIVVYMGAKNMPFIINKLIEHQMDKKIPVIIAEKLETSDEKIFLTTVGEAHQFLSKVENPAITLIGKVLDMASDFYKF